MIGLGGCTGSSSSAEVTATPDADPPALVALGDSISVGFAACGEAQPCPDASWVTGGNNEVNSFERRLEAAWGADVEATNLARPSAAIAELPSQAGRVPEGTEGLVTVLIGANDVCADSVPAMTAPQQFRMFLDDALARIQDRAPDAVVLLSSLPDVPMIFRALQEEPRARTAWARGGICPSLVGAAAGSPDAGGTVAQVEERVDELETQLQEACAAMEGCVFDGGAVHDWEPTIEDVSIVDAFHPSLAGQAHLAERLWEAAAEAPQTEVLLGP